MKKYELIYVDPPWRYRSGKVREPQLTITLQCQMRNYISFPVAEIAEVLFSQRQKVVLTLAIRNVTLLPVLGSLRIAKVNTKTPTTFFSTYNSYTNRLAGFVLTEAVRILSQSREDEKLAEALGEADCEYWEKRFKEDTEKLVQKKPGTNGVIEQFDRCWRLIVCFCVNLRAIGNGYIHLLR